MVSNKGSKKFLQQPSTLDDDPSALEESTETTKWLSLSHNEDGVDESHEIDSYPDTSNIRGFWSVRPSPHSLIPKIKERLVQHESQTEAKDYYTAPFPMALRPMAQRKSQR